MTSKRAELPLGEGERLDAERRRRFYKIVIWIAAGGAIGGFMAGVVAGYSAGGGNPVPEWLLTVAACAVVLSVIIGCYASWRYFAAVDEVEVADNLWASLVGFYVYAFLYPAWVLIALFDRAPEPNHLVIYVVTIVSSIAAYGLRKWRNR